jgi:hypothetical protein
MRGPYFDEVEITAEAQAGLDYYARRDEQLQGDVLTSEEDLDRLLAGIDDELNGDDPADASSDAGAEEKVGPTGSPAAADSEPIAAAKVEPSKTGPYSFPAHLFAEVASLRIQDTETLIGTLQECAGAPFVALGRDAFCTICLALIERGVSPGLLNPRSGIKRPSNLSPEQANESNDRQVLDLFRLYHHRKSHVRPDDREMDALFRGDSFDFGLASRIVSTKGSPSQKAEMLKLPADVQLELLMLQEAEQKALLKGHYYRRQQVDRALHDRALQSGSRLKPESIPEYLRDFTCLDLAGGSPKRAAEIRSFMTGEPIGKALVQRMRDRGRNLGEMIGVKFEPAISDKTGRVPNMQQAIAHVEARRKKPLGPVGGTSSERQRVGHG